MDRSRAAITRRQMLQRLALALGGTLSSPIVAAALSDARMKSAGGAWRPRTLSAAQDELVTAIAESILPATGTPGAAAAGVNRFIDLLMSDWLDVEERDRFLAGLDDLEARCRERFERPFLALTTAERLAVLEPLDVEAVEARRATDPSSQSRIDNPSFFASMKEMTLVGYYTSEIGMTQELKYMENPGSYDGCVPLAEIGRTWA